MENCIRQLRKERGLTLAGLAQRCTPQTTAQTIGRLETGMRTLSLDWLDRIADALDVAPTRLINHDAAEPHLTARLNAHGIIPLDTITKTALPRFGSHVRLVAVDWPVADFLAGDLLWFESLAPERLDEAINRIVLLPGRAGSFHIGRLAGVANGKATLLPLDRRGSVEDVPAPAWAARLRKLIRTVD